jgi:hypothetical protein
VIQESPATKRLQNHFEGNRFYVSSIKTKPKKTRISVVMMTLEHLQRCSVHDLAKIFVTSKF